MRLHLRLAELCRRKVAALEEALNDVEERGEAAEIMRSLIDKVVLTPETSDRKVNAKLYGAGGRKISIRLIMQTRLASR